MGLTLVCWKYRNDVAAHTSDPNSVVSELLKDQSHPALTRFDIAAFKSSLRVELQGSKELAYTMDTGDFVGHPSNWILIDAGFETGALMQPALLRAAAAHGLVVYSDSLGRLLTMKDALEDLAAIEAYRGQRQSFNDRFDQILHGYLSPAAKQLKLKPTKRQFSWIKGDYYCHFFPFHHDLDPTFLISVLIGFKSVDKFLDDLRAFRQEPPTRRSNWQLQFNLGEFLEKPANLFWRLDSEHGVEAVGRQTAETLLTSAPIAIEKFSDMRRTAQWWAANYKSRTELVGMYWILGEKDRARAVISERLAELETLIKQRYYPPYKGERIDLTFLQRFLDTLPANPTS